MDSGFYAAATALRAQSEALEIAVHNLANLNSNGYRAQQVTFRSLVAANNSGDALNQAINDYGLLQGTRTDLTGGSLERTGNALDFGIEGSSFFAIETGRGIRYTRNGNFHVSPQGKLIDADGGFVLGAQGAIAIPNGNASVSPDGTISVSGAVAGRLRLVKFGNDTPLTAEGRSYYVAPEGAGKTTGEPVAPRGKCSSCSLYWSW